MEKYDFSESEDENPHGFIEPDELKTFKKTRKQRKLDALNTEKEKYVHTRRTKTGGSSNKEKEKLCEELNININDPDNFDLDYTKKNLFKFIKNLSSEEISFINKELKDYIQC